MWSGAKPRVTSSFPSITSITQNGGKDRQNYDFIQAQNTFFLKQFPTVTARVLTAFESKSFQDFEGGKNMVNEPDVILR
ncbi:hypothetical protein EDS67_22520 [candidate division KSB1 bacterium]|nr:MAG: hypothetical protein EDS67_22520 [candidate division KSB1 bacterium]MBC6947065.1 hypothetical protein [candidate division KSB1 bacterium]MCE7944823.1 hypothetical protein [Chlorobi bacterium CHB1]